MFNIRLLEESDAPEFQRLRLEALQNDPVAFGSSWEEERTRTLESIGQRLRVAPNGNFVAGAFNDCRLIGMVGLFREDRPKTRHKGMIWGVYVSPEERGKGVARALLKTALERVQGYEGLDQVNLSVAAPQMAARHLYDSLGFEIYGYERRALKIGDNYIDEEHRTRWIRPPSPP